MLQIDDSEGLNINSIDNIDKPLISVRDYEQERIEKEEDERKKRNFSKIQEKEDLNGINPVIPIIFSVVPAGMAYVGWQLSAYLGTHFAIQFLDSDIYPIKRAAVVARNLIVGISTLATGFSAVVSIGLFALGITVAIGIIRGELNPNFTKNDNIDNTSNSSP
eukprot:gene19266-25123_t